MFTPTSSPVNPPPFFPDADGQAHTPVAFGAPLGRGGTPAQANAVLGASAMQARSANTTWGWGTSPKPAAAPASGHRWPGTPLTPLSSVGRPALVVDSAFTADAPPTPLPPEPVALSLHPPPLTLDFRKLFKPPTARGVAGATVPPGAAGSIGEFAAHGGGFGATANEGHAVDVPEPSEGRLSLVPGPRRTHVIAATDDEFLHHASARTTAATAQLPSPASALVTDRGDTVDDLSGDDVAPPESIRAPDHAAEVAALAADVARAARPLEILPCDGPGEGGLLPAEWTLGPPVPPAPDFFCFAIVADPPPTLADPTP